MREIDNLIYELKICPTKKGEEQGQARPSGNTHIRVLGNTHTWVLRNTHIRVLSDTHIWVSGQPIIHLKIKTSYD